MYFVIGRTVRLASERSAFPAYPSSIALFRVENIRKNQGINRLTLRNAFTMLDVWIPYAHMRHSENIWTVSP